VNGLRIRRRAPHQQSIIFRVDSESAAHDLAFVLFFFNPPREGV